jgi:predicted CoA-binding protein
VNDDAIAAADRAGLDVVVYRCLKVEAARLLP